MTRKKTRKTRVEAPESLRRNTSDGSRIDRKIVACSSTDLYADWTGQWFLIDEKDVPSSVEQVIDSMPPPTIGQHVVKTTSLDAGHILLVYWPNPKHIATKFFIVPHPEA